MLALRWRQRRGSVALCHRPLRRWRALARRPRASTARAATCSRTGCPIPKRASFASASTSLLPRSWRWPSWSCAPLSMPTPSSPSSRRRRRAAGIRARTSAQQTYWTVLGVDGGRTASLLSEDGVLEPVPGVGALEPFLIVDGNVLGWADVRSSHTLRDGDLPMPSVHWRAGDLALDIERVRRRHARCGAGARALPRPQPGQGRAAGDARTGVAAVPGESADAVSRPSRRRERDRRIGLGRPGPHGERCAEAARARRTERRAARAVGGRAGRRLAARASSVARSGAPRRPGRLRQRCAAVRPEARCRRGARGRGGAARRRRAHGTRTGRRRRGRGACGRALARPPGPRAHLGAGRGRRDRAHVAHFARPHPRQPQRGQPCSRDARAYARSWIRDGALTSSALLRLGQDDVARDFLLWFAPFQFESGKVPCCATARGADPVPEHDSDGEFAFAAADLWQLHPRRSVRARAVAACAPRGRAHGRAAQERAHASEPARPIAAPTSA